jgi:hypothetical protein
MAKLMAKSLRIVTMVDTIKASSCHRMSDSRLQLKRPLSIQRSSNNIKLKTVRLTALRYQLSRMQAGKQISYIELLWLARQALLSNRHNKAAS